MKKIKLDSIKMSSHKPQSIKHSKKHSEKEILLCMSLKMNY